MENKTLSTILKIFGFSLLAIAGYNDFSLSSNRFFQDPFFIGASIMVIASVLTLINPSTYYIHTGMFFFIFMKIISQYTHSKHYTFWGKSHHH